VPNVKGNKLCTESAKPRLRVADCEACNCAEDEARHQIAKAASLRNSSAEAAATEHKALGV